MPLRGLRLTLRTLLKRPGFSATIILTLALGIGANTAIFSVVNSVLINSLPFASPEHLVSLWPEGALPLAGVELLRQRGQQFEEVTGYAEDDRMSLTGRGEPLSVRSSRVMANFFSTLGRGALHGRTFVEGEDFVDRNRVVILSHALFKKQFGADSNVIGSSVTLNGIDRQVVGVMPPTFQFPSPDVEAWIPVSIDPTNLNAYWGGPWVRTIGRIRSGSSVAAADTDFQRLLQEVRAGFPWPMGDEWGAAARAVPLQQQMVGNVRLILLVLLASVGLVLLVACVNIASLLLLRAHRREKELAIRGALGADRKQLIMESLRESLLLGLLGGATGFVIGFWGVDLLKIWIPSDMPRIGELGLDLRVLGFTLLLTLAAGLLFGLLPALRGSRFALQSSLNGVTEGAGTSVSHRRITTALVVGEIGLAVLLAIGAGLLNRSFRVMLEIDPGFRAEALISALVSPPESRYDSEERRRQYFAELTAKLEAVPGHEYASVTSQLPFSEGHWGSAFLIDGRPFPNDGSWPLSEAFAIVGPTYHQTVGIPLLKGRFFTEADRVGSSGVAIISAGLANRYWPDQEVLDERVKLPGTEAWLTIVGVVGDIKMDDLGATSPAALYLPHLQSDAALPMSVVIRTATEPSLVAQRLRDVVAAIDSNTPVSDFQTLPQLISSSLEKRRFIMSLVLSFAALALLLSAIGIYGVMAYAVKQRNREIALRMALGAEKRRVLFLILKEAAFLSAGGIALGLVAALGLTRLIEKLLYGVSPTDPVTFIVVPLILLVVAALASYLPSRRAMGIEPIRVLRSE